MKAIFHTSDVLLSCNAWLALTLENADEIFLTIFVHILNASPALPRGC
eukprot:UN11553